MKTPIILLLFLFISRIGISQAIPENKVPEIIKTSFHTNFKDVKKTNWDLESDGDYEAEFIQNGIETSATFKLDGTLWETEWSIKKEKLPSSILPFVKANYKGCRIQETSQIIDYTGFRKFEVEIKHQGVIVELLFNEQGKRIQ